MGAAQHDGDVSHHGPSGMRIGQGRGQASLCRNGGESTLTLLTQKLLQGPQVGWRQEKIYIWELLPQGGVFLRDTTDQAPHKGHDAVRIMPLEFRDVAETPVDLVLGLLTHNTGIQEQ